MIRESLSRLTVAFQPIVNVSSGLTFGYEVLLRGYESRDTSRRKPAARLPRLRRSDGGRNPGAPQGLRLAPAIGIRRHPHLVLQPGSPDSGRLGSSGRHRRRRSRPGQCPRGDRNHRHARPPGRRQSRPSAQARQCDAGARPVRRHRGRARDAARGGAGLRQDRPAFHPGDRDRCPQAGGVVPTDRHGPYAGRPGGRRRCRERPATAGMP